MSIAGWSEEVFQQCRCIQIFSNAEVKIFKDGDIFSKFSNVPSPEMLSSRISVHNCGGIIAHRNSSSKGM